ncbi:MAG: insulinase family protein [Clostridia bacterium]|nr:insulinase family protein [Clostridia bacterium]
MTIPLQAGIPLTVFSLPALHGFCLCLYVRAGSMFETEEEGGLTHFTEHMVFRNINRLMEGDLYRELDRNGLCMTGVTYREFVRFSISGEISRFDEAASIFARLLAPFSLTREDLRIEKGRIRAEIWEENEKTSLDAFTDSVLYGDNGLSRPITGTPAQVSAVTLKKLKAYRQKMFSANNCFFCMAGPLRSEDAFLLDRLTAPYTLSADFPKRENIAPVSPYAFHRDGVVRVQPGSKTEVSFAFDLDMKTIKDPVLTLLYDILFGDGEECKLHRALSEKTGLIYSFRSSLETYSNVGVMRFSYEIQPSLLEKAVALSLDVLKKSENITEEDIAYVIAPYTGNASLCLDDGENLMDTLVYEKEILGLPYGTVEERSSAFRSVKAKDVRELARQIFRKECFTLTVKGKNIHTSELEK